MSAELALPLFTPVRGPQLRVVAEPASPVLRAAARRSGRSVSPLQLVADQFAVLNARDGFQVDGTGLPGLPDQSLDVEQLRSRLLHPATTYATRDAVFNWLLVRANDRRSNTAGDWQIIVAGMLLPGVRAALRPMRHHHPELAIELEAEALTGLFDAASRIAPPSSRVAARLTWAAHGSAKAFLQTERNQRQALEQVAADPGHFSTGSERRVLAGDPESVLAAAVAAGVVSAADAALIAATRLNSEPLRAAGMRLGLTHAAVKKRRIRAETRLVGWIRARRQTASD